MSDSAAQSAYWRTGISRITSTDVVIRGFSLFELIGGVTFTQAVYLLIRGEVPTPGQTRVLDAVLDGVLDYGLEKPGTAAARFAVSANPSMAAGLAAASLAVGENTLATEFAGRFIRDTYADYLQSGQTMNQFARDRVEILRAQRQRIPGLGHPVFKRFDPRAQKLRSIAVDEGLWGDAAELYEAMHREFTSLPGKQDIPINDVGVLAAIIDSLGFTPEEGTGLAILSTIPGLIAHISEELGARVPIRVIPRDQVDYDVVDDRDLETALTTAGWVGAPSPEHR